MSSAESSRQCSLVYSPKQEEENTFCSLIFNVGELEEFAGAHGLLSELSRAPASFELT